MKKIKFHLLILSLILSAYFLTGSLPASAKNQSAVINRIIKSEKNSRDKKEIISIISYIDNTYGNLDKKLRDGGKITIFFDPAHGKDDSGRWRGTITNRIGVTGKPEEYYSIIYSRKLYNLLKNNKYLRIVTSDDFQRVLDGKSESYHYLKFRTTVGLARKAGAFIIIAEHMNNVSIFNKADGILNIPGIHMARDKKNRKLLRDIRGTYSGFLTLYNKYDASGFSKHYAYNIKKSLEKKGYRANSWEFGAVGDDRFTYYVDYPVSVIYENGFISHPEEEKKLLDPYYSDGQIRTHYDALLKTINDIYGVDISGKKLRITKKNTRSRLDLLKLSRIAIYYIQHASTGDLNRVMKVMKKYYGRGKYKDTVAYYSNIQNKINYSEKLYKKGRKYKKRRWHSRARRYFSRARNNLTKNSLYYAYKGKYKRAIYGNRKSSSSSRKYIARKWKWNKKYRETAVSVSSSSITKPVIITVNEKKDLALALNEALAPDSRSLNSILNSLRNYKKVKWVKYRVWSRKKKRRITKWKKIVEKPSFSKGIYIVKLDKNMDVIKAKKVSAVYLDPKKYQNQKYLKNSYFAEPEKYKQL